MQDPTMPPMSPPPSQHAPAGDALIQDADLQSFGAKVMEASMQVPVLVDFWADWCGPCKQLMPMLEKAVVEAAGAVKLVKINADENQEICGQLRIQSLPTVMAFFQGQPIDGFQGAQPESKLKEFIQGVISKTGAAPAEGSMEAQIKQALEQIDAMLTAAKDDPSNQEAMTGQATAMLGQILQADPENAKAKIIFAEIALQSGNIDQVKEILSSLDAEALKADKDLSARQNQLQTQLDLMAQTEGLSDKITLLEAIDKDPKDHQARFDLSLIYTAEGDNAKAAEELLRVLMVDMEWQDQQARKQLLKLFEAAGPTDPFTLKYRRRLSSLIFS